MFWVIFLVGLAVIAIFALAATGALGELKSDDSLDTASPYESGQRIPQTLFGYQKSRVDRIIADFQCEIDSLKSKKK